MSFPVDPNQPKQHADPAQHEPELLSDELAKIEQAKDAQIANDAERFFVWWETSQSAGMWATDTILTLADEHSRGVGDGAGFRSGPGF